MSKPKVTGTKRQRDLEKRKKKHLKLQKRIIKNSDKVISIYHGIGKIGPISKLHDGLEDYHQVFFERDKNTEHFPVKGLRKFRDLSCEDQLLRVLTRGRQALDLPRFESLEHRLNYLILSIEGQDIRDLVCAIIGFRNFKNLSSTERKLLVMAQNSLQLEIIHVLNISEDEAQNKLNKFLNQGSTY